MTTWLPGPAAHADLWSAAPAVEPLESAQSQAILEALGISGVVERLALRHDYPQGYYKLTSFEGRVLFLKIVASDKLERCRRADSLARFVAEAGATTSLLCPGFPKPILEGFFIFGYDYMSGRYGNAVPADLQRLGAALARLHHALKGFSGADLAREDSESRAALVQRWCARAERGGDLPGSDRRRVASVLAGARTRSSGADRQMLHGDLNRGNILFCDDGRVAVLDFETSLSSWGDPALDLAVALQRFVLVPSSEQSEIKKLVRALLDAYESEGLRHSFTEGADIVADLHWISARNIALLCEISSRGNSVGDTEWEKQLMLAELTRSRRDALFAALSTSVQ